MTGDEETDDDNATTVTQAAAAATTGSTLGNTYGATGTMASFPAEVTAAIQQLWANQTTMMQQCSAFTVNNQPPPTRHNVQVSPVTNINIPQQQYGGFQQTPWGFQQGRERQQGGGRSHGGGRGGRRGGRTQNVYAQAPGGIPQYAPRMGGPPQNYMTGFNNGGNVPTVAGRQATGRGGRQNQNPAYSN